MARAPKTETVATAQNLVGEVLSGQTVTPIPTWFERSETLVARRLYEVWRTVGQLSDERWEWDKQSTRAQAAWRAVARATMPRVFEKDFGPTQIATINHG